MNRIKRTSFAFFAIDDAPVIDFASLLRGKTAVEMIKSVYALSLLRGEEFTISLKELEVLFSLPADEWMSTAQAMNDYSVDAETLGRFAHQGLIVTDDDDDGDLSQLRTREQKLGAGQWHPYAALYHFLTKWRDVDVSARFPDTPEEWQVAQAELDSAYRQFIQKFGKPPPAFVEARTEDLIRLPLTRKSEGVFELLMKRRTTRAFDRDVPLKLDNLSVILYYVFGCHGTSTVYEDLVAVKKTSPSGGGLHPTEVYVLAMNVADLRPGLYHYNVEHHGLEAIKLSARDEAERLANEFTAGQSYPTGAQALFILTSRFYRNFWKYRRHQRAYAVLLMDVAHLSQTLYLVCAELGLGAFVTAAVNAQNIETELGIDGYTEGAMAVCGCGAPAMLDLIDPQFTPFTIARDQQPTPPD